MSTLRDRAEAAEAQVARLQAQIEHAEKCLFFSAVQAVLGRCRYAAEYGEFGSAATYQGALVAAYVVGLYFLTHEDPAAIRARVQKAADEKMAKEGQTA